MMTEFVRVKSNSLSDASGVWFDGPYDSCTATQSADSYDDAIAMSDDIGIRCVEINCSHSFRGVDNAVACVVQAPSECVGSDRGAYTWSYKCTFARVGSGGGLLDVVVASCVSDWSIGVGPFCVESEETGVETGLDALHRAVGGMTSVEGCGEWSMFAMFTLCSLAATRKLDPLTLMLESPYCADVCILCRCLDMEGTRVVSVDGDTGKSVCWTHNAPEDASIYCEGETVVTKSCSSDGGVSGVATSGMGLVAPGTPVDVDSVVHVKCWSVCDHEERPSIEITVCSETRVCWTKIE